MLGWGVKYGMGAGEIIGENAVKMGAKWGVIVWK